MREWAETNGVFIPLDDYYDAITFREPSRPGYEFAPQRDQATLDLSQRPRHGPPAFAGREMV